MACPVDLECCCLGACLAQRRVQTSKISKHGPVYCWRFSDVVEGGVDFSRIGEGEFFQLYSCNYGEGFFFEIVQRRGGYNGYGAGNAQFRIAAQKRLLRPRDMPRASSGTGASKF